MVKIDRTEWPIVYIDVDGLITVAAMEEYNREMDAFLDYAETVPEKYGIIYVYELTDEEQKSQKREKEAQKLGNAWLKVNKARIGERCIGIAMVTPNAGTLLKMMRPIAKRSMKRMMGAPGDMFFERKEAEAWMRTQMSV